MLSGSGEATLQRITLITDEALEKMVLDQAQRLGADSYICSFCSGKPLHNAVELPSDTRALVRIELLARATAAQDILAYVQQLHRRNYPVTVMVDAVLTLPQLCGSMIPSE